MSDNRLGDGRESSCDQPVADDVCKSEHLQFRCNISRRQLLIIESAPYNPVMVGSRAEVSRWSMMSASRSTHHASAVAL